MNTKRVQVVSGYTYPTNKHVLWFDENENVFKHWDGNIWVSDGSSDGRGGSKGEQKNFYYKEVTVPSQVIWNGNAHSGDRIENFIQEPVAGDAYSFELSDGTAYSAYWGDEQDFTIYANKIYDKDISVGYRSFGQDDYGWVFINDSDNNDANLVKISTEETIENVLVWDHVNSLPITMPKCVNDNESDLMAVFGELPEEGRAYYIPFIDENNTLFIPVLISECHFEQTVEGTCYSLCGEPVYLRINGNVENLASLRIVRNLTYGFAAQIVKTVSETGGPK